MKSIRLIVLLLTMFVAIGIATGGAAEPATVNAKSAVDAVARAAEFCKLPHGQVVYAPFVERHTLGTRSFLQGKRRAPFDVLPKAALVDVDNDGTVDALARMVLWSNGGRCGFIKLAMLNRERDAVAEGDSQNLLDELPASCDSKVQVFRFEERSFIESTWQAHAGPVKTVHLIDHGELHQVCEHFPAAVPDESK